ncbi:MAG: ATP-binding protein [Gammaproteobacteria bacterium]|nr:ATP-binding protein [Gammaproteobacteria bacterium]MDH3507535.1 ATP-binding protein [Gammaproteobacteria bacterium]
MANEARSAAPASEVQAQIHYRLIERLSESERRYRALVENLGHPVLQCDLSGRLDYLNTAWHSLTGHDPESSLGRSLVEFVDPVEVPVLKQALAVVSAGEGSAVTCEFRLRKKNGGYADVGLSLGKASSDSLVGSLRDLTHEKETQRSLEQARDAAEEASRLKSSFLANMSHEIRTPLSAVLGYAGLLAAGDVEAEERQDCVARINRNGQHLLALVNDILDFSRIESGKVEVFPEPFVLCEFIDDLEREHKVTAREKGLLMTTRWSGAFPADQQLVADRTRLRQILTNLLTNAVKFTSNGSVSLEIESDVRSQMIRFTVTDTGIGIAPEKVSTLFEPFRQADETITRRFGGTGLGLAISARLAKLLGGTLVCESEPGSGSRFVLEVPLRTQQATSGESKADLSNAGPLEFGLGQHGRVLIVEDTADLRKLMVCFCEGLGLEAETASDGAEALERLAEGASFKAILMDMQMPVMDGYSATRELRANGYGGLVIAMTAHAMSGDREKCLDAGCDDYLAKPVSVASLRSLLMRHWMAKE